MNTKHLNDDLIRSAIARRVTAADESNLRERVLAATAAYPQRRGWRIRLDGERLISPRGLALRLSVALVLLATAALVAALIGAGFHDTQLPVAPGLGAIVVELPNRLEGDASRVAHTGFTPGANGGTPVSVRLPANALGLRWSHDGQRLVYFAAEDRPGGLGGHVLAPTGLFVARADGADAVAIRAPRPVDQYMGIGWDGGARWAPTGGLFALTWSTFTCSGGPDCIPPSGIDVFDAAGNVVQTIDVVDGDFGEAIWSPDGLALGWLTGTCADSNCSTDAFHWQRVDRDSPVITLPLDGGGVIWATDGLLHGVDFRDEPYTIGDTTYGNLFVDRVFTMRPDGADVRDVPWPKEKVKLIPSWSPNGRLLAVIDREAGSLTIHDVATGRDVVVSLPAVIDIADWAPDSGRIVLYGDGAVSAGGGYIPGGGGYSFSVIGADGTGFVSLGGGDDFAWAPPAVVSRP